MTTISFGLAAHDSSRPRAHPGDTMTNARAKSRYRRAPTGDQACIDIRLRTASQLFDGRDPAPFRERDLDEDAVDYIYAAAEEISPPTRLKLVLFLEEPTAPALSASIIGGAIRAHFEHEREQVGRRLRQQRRFGRVALLLGLGLLIALLTLAELVNELVTGHVRQVLREGLVITGWVAMWRPLEVLLYDWWPLAQRRRQIARILDAEVEILEPPPT